MKRKLFIVCLLLFAAAGCDGGPENFSEDLGTTEVLQIFRRGEDQPLSRLGGLHPGDRIELEAKAKGLSTPPQWFTADATRGDFSSPGQLHLKKAGRFLVGAVVGDQSAYIKVEVQALSSPGGSGNPPQDPGSDPGHPSDPGDPGDPDPPVDQPPVSVPSDSFMDEVTSFHPGPHAGFGSPDFPQIVLGPPQGGGNLAGSFHVLSLGVGGEIVLKSATPIFNGAAEDFIVFENAFFAGGNPNAPFVELGQVSVSQDGVHFVAFNCQTQNAAEFYPGCAGVHPVLANPELNDIDPTDPDAAGGDAFDLDDLGLSWALYVKIKDLSMTGAGVSAGFDLDAIAIIHQ